MVDKVIAEGHPLPVPKEVPTIPELKEVAEPRKVACGALRPVVVEFGRRPLVAVLAARDALLPAVAIPAV